jgi:hypothetical protein
MSKGLIATWWRALSYTKFFFAFSEIRRMSTGMFVCAEKRLTQPPKLLFNMSPDQNHVQMQLRWRNELKQRRMFAGRSLFSIVWLPSPLNSFLPFHPFLKTKSIHPRDPSKPTNKLILNSKKAKTPNPFPLFVLLMETLNQTPSSSTHAPKATRKS